MATDKPSKPATPKTPRLPMATPDGAETAYEARTRSIAVRVTPEFDADRSKPERAQFFWLYTVEIRNEGEVAVQLLSRHWRITDGQGRLQEIKGPGVVGQTPTLAPGEEFRYTSGCPLTTPTGFMAGTYQMITAAGAHFDAAIPAFSLDSPHVRRSLN